METRIATRYLDVDILICLGREMGVQRLRDVGVLVSAVTRARASLWGEDVYPSLEAKGAALLQEILAGRPYNRYNRVLAWRALTVFLAMNGLRVELSGDEILRLVDDVVSGELVSVAQIADRLPTYSAGLKWADHTTREPMIPK